MFQKGDFHELDLDHSFNPFSDADRITLDRGRRVLQRMSEDLARDVYWFCVRHWLEKQAQAELYDKYFADKQEKPRKFRWQKKT